MTEQAIPKYRFHMRYVNSPHDSYYRTRWDLARPASVLASTQKEADKKLGEMLGPPGGGRAWSVTVDRIEEVEPTKGAQP